MAESKHKLPVRQLVILAICRFAEPISLTSIYPYLPEMIQSFGIAERDVGFWAGMAGTAYSLAQCFTAILWGRAADRFGRKYTVIIGLINTLITQLLWGFSTSLPLALTARALSGAGNGNVGIIRTIVAELCPSKELQPRAFSLMPMVYSIGSILGPSLGGALANPLKRSPYDTSKSNNLLWEYPYALPNLVSACFFLVSVLVGTLFLQETLASKKTRLDYGLLVGQRISNWFKMTLRRTRSEQEEESDPLLPRELHTREAPRDQRYQTVISQRHEAQEDNKLPKNKQDTSGRLSTQTWLNLIIYTLIALQSFTFDMLLPVFMSYPQSGPDVGETHLPFMFSKGFGLESNRIGLFFAFAGVVGIVNLLVCPSIIRSFGALRCLRVGLWVMPVIYLITPYSALVPSVTCAQTALLLIWLVKTMCSTIVYPCTTMLYTNTAPSLKVLGTINGMATSFSAVGRSLGPSIGGPLFTWGVKRGFIITPFWVLAALSALGPLTALWLVEGLEFDAQAGTHEETDTWVANNGGD